MVVVVVVVVRSSPMEGEAWEGIGGRERVGDERRRLTQPEAVPICSSNPLPSASWGTVMPGWGTL